MKIINQFLLIVLLHTPILATDQVPDILEYDGISLTLETHWIYPSPIEVFFNDANVKYPFKWHRTSNYRGHIAYWVIDDNKLFLRELKVDGKICDPKNYNIHSISKEYENGDHIFADWFSGIIYCAKRKDSETWKKQTHYYFHIKKGVVIDKYHINDDEYWRTLERKGNIESINPLLVKHYKYMSYYSRLHMIEKIAYNDRDGWLESFNSRSPLLGYYDYDHIEWPYNWESMSKYGAPNCEWIINNEKIYLTKIRLYSGVHSYNVDKDSVELSELFSNPGNLDQVFAEWINGVFIVKFGEPEIRTETEYKEFELSDFVIIKIVNGIVIEAYTGQFDFNRVEIDTLSNVKQKSLLKEFFKL